MTSQAHIFLTGFSDTRRQKGTNMLTGEGYRTFAIGRGGRMSEGGGESTTEGVVRSHYDTGLSYARPICFGRWMP